MPTPWSRTRTATAPSLPATVMSMGVPSACSRALTRTLRTILSTRTVSICATTGSSGAWTRTSAPRRSMWIWLSAMTASTRAVRSCSATDSRTFPESTREMASRSSNRRRKRVTSRRRMSRERRASGSSISSRTSSSRSAARVMEVSGVRSSWETSETNSRCTLDRRSQFSSWRARESAISLKECDSVAISSSPVTFRRSSRWPSARRWAAREVRRTGMRTPTARAHTVRTSMSRKPMAARAMARVVRSISCCSGWSV